MNYAIKLAFPVQWKKKIFARLFSSLGFSTVLFGLQKFIYPRGYIRGIHYHGTDGSYTANFEKQIKYFRRYFSNVTKEDLHKFLQKGHWHKSKPGLIISFDDGLRSNFLHAAPIMERYGFTGWFFVPTSLISTNSAGQIISGKGQSLNSDGKKPIFMSWDDLRKLDKHHVIGSHTRTHARPQTCTNQDTLWDEVMGSKRDLEEKLGHSVDIFCWVGGELNSYTADAAQMIAQAGYRFSFLTDSMPILPGTNPMQMFRTQIEANWPLYVVKFQLSGLMDIRHAYKRRRVNRIISIK
jgi:peptidoglycan/xylan/chitin deacetylase (PgdA/CDA1 family)